MQNSALTIAQMGYTAYVKSSDNITKMAKRLPVQMAGQRQFVRQMEQEV